VSRLVGAEKKVQDEKASWRIVASGGKYSLFEFFSIRQGGKKRKIKKGGERGKKKTGSPRLQE